MAASRISGLGIELRGVKTLLDVLFGVRVADDGVEDGRGLGSKELWALLDQRALGA